MNELIKIIIERTLRIFKLELKSDIVNVLVQFIGFCIIGVTNTAIGYITNIAMLIVLQPYSFWWDYFAANFFSFICGATWSFYWNNRLVFKMQDGQTRNALIVLLKTYASYGFTGIILNNILSYIWIDWMKISKMIAPLINMIISVPINFMLNKMWAYKENK